jgi:hypothetical protein
MTARVLLAGLLTAGIARRAGRGFAPPPTGQAGAVIDLTGYWVSQVNED